MAIDMVMDLRPVAAAAEPTQLKYDYTQVAITHRERVMRAATVIHEAGQVARKSIIQIGRELTEVKKRLDHGQFGEWLRAEFDMSERTAQNMMNVARQYSDESAIISFLSDTVLYMLAAPSTPEDARAEIEQAAAEGEKVTVEFAKEAIQKHKPEPRPEPPRYAPVWELERAVGEFFDNDLAGMGDDPYAYKLSVLQYMRRSLDNHPDFLRLSPHLPQHYRKSDLIQALGNVREQRRQAKSQASAKTVYVEPKPAPPNVPPDPTPDPPHRAHAPRVASAWDDAEELEAMQDVAEELAGEDVQRVEREAVARLASTPTQRVRMGAAALAALAERERKSDEIRAGTVSKAAVEEAPATVDATPTTHPMPTGLVKRFDLRNDPTPKCLAYFDIAILSPKSAAASTAKAGSDRHGGNWGVFNLRTSELQEHEHWCSAVRAALDMADANMSERGGA